MDPSVQILKPWLKVRFVILPRHAIHAGRGFALERVVRRPERVDVEVVEERSELFSGSCISGYGSSPSRHGPFAPIGPMADPEISRFPHKERLYMPGSQTTQGRADARITAPARFAFRQVNNVGTLIHNDLSR
jgi:hypothetical protein